MNQLLHYLIKAHEMDWDIKKSLEDNASKLILTSGIIIPIFFGLVLISDRSLDVVQIFFLLSVIFFWNDVNMVCNKSHKTDLISKYSGY